MQSTRITGAFVAVVGLAIVTGHPSASAPSPTRSGIRVVGLTTEYQEHPLGIDAPHPRLSWKLDGPGRAIVQTGYQIRVARSERDLRAGTRLVWDSTRVASDQSILRPYDGPALTSGQRYVWQVRIVDGAGATSDWSDAAWWEMGLLQPADWRAKWIEPAIPDDANGPSPSPYLRRTFIVSGDVARARLYMTSHGLYQAHLNGQRVGDQLFTPGWTSYNKRLQYRTYSVTSQVSRGANTIGVVLGSGWYRGELAWSGHRNLYGAASRRIAPTRDHVTNGRTDIVTSDEQWKSSAGPIVASEIYLGETYNARRELSGWTTASYSDAQWSGVRVVQAGTAALVAPQGPPVRRIEEVKAVKSDQDAGRRLGGGSWTEHGGLGSANRRRTGRHDRDAAPRGSARQGRQLLYREPAHGTDRFTLKGGGVETFEPHFTFHGFRYVAVDGYPGTLTPDSLTGIVIHSDMAPAASSSARSRSSISCSTTSGGARRAISSTCPPTALSATSGLAGPATRRCSRVRRHSTWMSPASSPSG